MTIQDSKPGGDYAIVQLRTRVKEAISKTEIKNKNHTEDYVIHFLFPISSIFFLTSNSVSIRIQKASYLM